MMIAILIITYLWTRLVIPAAAACFYPDGSVAQDTPCTDSTAESTCCGVGYACLGHSSSFFLCEATGDEFQKPGASQYVRGSCTDKTWRSSNCPNVCVDPDRDNTQGGNGVAPCPGSDVLFYCVSAGLGADNCSTGFNLIDFSSEPAILTTIGIVPSSTTTTTSSSVTPRTSSAPPSTEASTSSPASAGNSEPAATTLSASSSSSHSGTTIGVAVGVSIGGLGLIAGAVAIWFLVRKKRRTDGVPKNITAVHQDPGRNLSTFYDPYKQPGHDGPYEAPVNESGRRYELPDAMASRLPNLQK